VKAISCFETKKAAKPVHAANGILGKKEMLPLMDKGVVGATLELRCALTCLKVTAITGATVITGATEISTATEIFTETEISTDTAITMAITISTDTATSTTILCMEKSTECSESAITNTGKTPIAVENAVFILSSDTT